jgi:hypothetical protein
MDSYVRKNGPMSRAGYGVILAVFLLLSSVTLRANDVQISPTGPTFGLTNLQWGITGANGFNNNFFFSPLFLNESVCVYVYNNNTTNNHSFSVGISVNGNPLNTTPSDGSWLYLGSTNSVATGVATGVPGGMGAAVSGAPLVAVNLSNSVVLGGSPDTANVFIVQTTGTCFSGVNNANIINGNGVGTNVQGMVAPGFNGASVNPLLIGATKTPINQGVFVQGIDTFSTPPQVNVTNGITGQVILGYPPKPSASGEFVFAFYSPTVSSGSSNLVGPWACVEATSCANNSIGNVNSAFLNNYNPNQPVVINYSNSTQSQPSMAFVAYQKAPTIAQHANVASNSFAWNNLPGGQYVLVAFSCTAACIAGSVTDTQGSNYKLIAFNPLTGGTNSNTVYVFASTNGTAGGVFTTTINMLTGSVVNSEFLQLSNTTPAQLNLASTPLFTSNNLGTSNENDNGGLFTENGGYSVTQTNTLTPGGTTTFSLWQSTAIANTQFVGGLTGPGPHGIFYSCWVGVHVSAVSGTTPTLDIFFQDSTDNITFNDRMHFPQIVAVGSFIGAVSGGVGGITPAASTDGALAVSSKVDGPLGPLGRIKFVVGGTAPSFTFTWNVACR